MNTATEHAFESRVEETLLRQGGWRRVANAEWDEEGFILDVLASYTTYAAYYGLLKNVEDDPKLPRKKAARALAKFASLHPHNVEQKTEVIVEHFRRNVIAIAQLACYSFSCIQASGLARRIICQINPSTARVWPPEPGRISGTRIVLVLYAWLCTYCVSDIVYRNRGDDMHIHILWVGPYTYQEVLGFKSNTDHGLYLVTGFHPTYGRALLYIGETHDQTFCERFRQNDKVDFRDEWFDNSNNLQFYTGRIQKTEGRQNPGNRKRIEMIRKAERLLLAAHAPSWNRTGIDGIKKKESRRFDDIHVLNWGQYAMLLPEVSGARYGWKEYESITDSVTAKPKPAPGRRRTNGRLSRRSSRS